MDPVDDLLREKAEFEQGLVVLPGADADENCCEEPKNKSIGSATGLARLRHSDRGSPAMTKIKGSATRRPTVSPIHHEIQLITRSANGTAPRASRPPNANVALVRQQIGDRVKKRQRWRPLSSGAG